MIDFKKKAFDVLEKDMRALLAGESDLFRKASYNFGFVDRNLQPGNDSSGKMFRPLLLLSFTSAYAGNYERAIPVASAIQIFHNFSLVHDDIEDNDPLRRGRATAWALWGVPEGLNIGDFIFNLSFKSALRTETPFLKRSLEMLVLSYEKVVEGQQADIGFEKRKLGKVIEEEYLKMISGKSASLISVSCALGAYLAEKSEDVIQGAAEFGMNLGLAYQIYDDYMGLWGQEIKTGKKTASDIYKKKKSFPVIVGYRQCQEIERSLLEEMYAQDKISERQALEIIGILEETGTKEQTIKFFNQYRERALSDLKKLELDGQWQKYFEDIVNNLMRI